MATLFDYLVAQADRDWTDDARLVHDAAARVFDIEMAAHPQSK